MSRTKELKLSFENNINLFDWFSLFVPEGKSKYVETFLRTLKNTKNMDSFLDEIKENLKNKYNINYKNLDIIPTLHIIMMYRMMDVFFDEDDIKTFQKFCEYNERGLIKQNDVSQYKEFEDIKNAVNIAEIIVTNKTMEKQTLIVYEDDMWLLVRPLTFASSRKYGANTKWCTTQETNQEYFHKYSSKGVLIYCINKNSGYKVASFYSLQKDEPEFSFWDQKDKRIDSLETELTDNLKNLIKEVSFDKNAKTNKFLLSEEERLKEEKLSGLITNISNSFTYSGSTSLQTFEYSNNTTRNLIRLTNNEMEVETNTEPEQEVIPNLQYGSFENTTETE